MRTGNGILLVQIILLFIIFVKEKTKHTSSNMDQEFTCYCLDSFPEIIFAYTPI